MKPVIYTVGELIDHLSKIDRDTVIACSDYYYDCQEGVLKGISEDCLVTHNGVLYVDTCGVSIREDGTPYYTLRK